MTEFKKGDLVKLKSGGPKMTVEELWNDDELKCSWFDKDHKVQHATFSRDAVEIDTSVSGFYVA